MPYPTLGDARVLIVDDHPFMRRGLAQTIKDQPGLTVCGEAGTIAEALEIIKVQNPHLVVVDISLGTESGIELIIQIRQKWPEIRVLVSSMHDENLYAERAFRAGASGYVNKGEPPQIFVAALLRVKSGQNYFSDRMSRRLFEKGSEEKPAASRSPLETLSTRELQVFEFIGRGLTTKGIAAKLSLSPKTVETYRENIKQKLNLANATELTRSAVQHVIEPGRLHAAEAPAPAEV